MINPRTKIHQFNLNWREDKKDYEHLLQRATEGWIEILKIDRSEGPRGRVLVYTESTSTSDPDEI